jgi:hypothetical protein
LVPLKNNDPNEGCDVEDLARIKLAIERKRKEMHKTCERYGLSSGITLKISQELDMLLIQYEKKRSGFHMKTNGGKSYGKKKL